MQLRLGTFRLNWPVIIAAAIFLVGFTCYMGGFHGFNKHGMDIYYKGEANPLKAIKWFLVGWPILILLLSIAFVFIASFQSRQLLLATCAPLVLGCLGFVIIACWLGTNMNRFKAEGGWIDCRPTPKCNSLKTHMNAFLLGSIICALTNAGQIILAILSVRKLAANEANYAGVKTEDYVDVNAAEADLAIEDSNNIDLDAEEEHSLEP